MRSVTGLPFPEQRHDRERAVHRGRREQERVDAIEEAAVTGDERARVLRAGRALEHRLGEVAGLGKHGDHEPEQRAAEW